MRIPGRCRGSSPARLLGGALLLALLLMPSDRVGADENGPEDDESEVLAVFVSPQTAWQRVSEGALVLDARGRARFVLGHPAGAIRVDWRAFSDPEEPGRLHPDDAVLAERLGALGIERDRPVFVIGQWADGWGEEGRIFWMLDILGHRNVHIIEGGFAAWRAAGLPVSRGLGQGEPGRFVVERQTGLGADIEEVAAGEVALLDVRSPAEFTGATPFGSVRGGHLPGAQHLPWTSVFGGDGRLLPRDQLEALLPDLGRRLVVYCTGGVRSAFVYAVLRELGREDVANYAGSWWEYARSSYPAER